ncbi:MAG: hypothetical protein JWR16_1225 [Nevskia sp.]|nr:hypothetical protein [Nevskia sp.]
MLTPRRERRRWLLAPLAAVLIVWLLLILMRWMIRAPEGESAQVDDVPAVEMVRVQPKQDAPPQDQLPAAAPPTAPAAPPSLARPALPSINSPAIAIASPTVDIAIANAAVSLGLGNGSGLTGSSAFGGFAGGGGGGGSGAGYGTGEGFNGKPLIPLSTARPQMPDWACKQKIKGWVEVVFTVMTNGRVNNVKIVDAQPRGVYETAAIESISNWIYESGKQAREVKQRVEMDPADCAYNWR